MSGLENDASEFGTAREGVALLFGRSGQHRLLQEPREGPEALGRLVEVEVVATVEVVIWTVQESLACLLLGEGVREGGRERGHGSGSSCSPSWSSSSSMRRPTALWRSTSRFQPRWTPSSAS